MMRSLRTLTIGIALAPATTAAQQPPAVHELDRVVAVVGTSVITMTELETALLEMQQSGRPLPRVQADALRQVLDELIDAEILLQKARAFNITVPEAEVTAQVDRFIEQLRTRNFNGSDAELRRALAESDFGTLEKFKQVRAENVRNQMMQRAAVDTLEARGRKPTVAISEKEIEDEFTSRLPRLGNIGPNVTFRQIVLKPAATEAAHARAKALADSLLLALRVGADFDSVARAFSHDSGSAAKGGDLDWQRRGSFTPEFDAMAFSIRPGVLSPVVKTEFGYHIIRVDRVRPAEVRARHVLIMPHRDSTDVQRALETAQRVVAALRSGASYDSLRTAHHDPVEEGTITNRIPVDSLPPSYAAALKDVPVNGVAEPFVRPDNLPGPDKVVVLQVTSRAESGEPRLADHRENIRNQLREVRSMQRLLEQLRAETHVEIRLTPTPPGRGTQ